MPYITNGNTTEYRLYSYPDDTLRALLRAAHASNDDKTLYLALADKLEELNDPARAEFIRVQVALSEMKADDPKRAELEKRERELLEKHGQKWRNSVGIYADNTPFHFGLPPHSIIRLATPEQAAAYLRDSSNCDHPENLYWVLSTPELEPSHLVNAVESEQSSGRLPTLEKLLGGNLPPEYAAPLIALWANIPSIPDQTLGDKAARWTAQHGFAHVQELLRLGANPLIIAKAYIEQGREKDALDIIESPVFSQYRQRQQNRHYTYTEDIAKQANALVRFAVASGCSKEFVEQLAEHMPPQQFHDLISQGDPFYTALFHQRLEKVQSLLPSGGCRINYDAGGLAMQVALGNNQWDATPPDPALLCWLTRQGAALSGCYIGGEFGLHSQHGNMAFSDMLSYAADRDMPELLQAILERKDGKALALRVHTPQHRTPFCALDLAARTLSPQRVFSLREDRNPEIVSLLVDTIASAPPHESVEIYRHAIETGLYGQANMRLPDTKDPYRLGELLFSAAKAGDRSVAQEIIEAGGYAALRNDKNQTPADVAAKAGYAELAQYLQECAAQEGRAWAARVSPAVRTTARRGRK